MISNPSGGAQGEYGHVINIYNFAFLKAIYTLIQNTIFAIHYISLTRKYGAVNRVSVVTNRLKKLVQRHSYKQTLYKAHTFESSTLLYHVDITGT